MNNVFIDRSWQRSYTRAKSGIELSDMATALSQFLDQHFAATSHVARTNAARAEILGIDPSLYSKIIAGAVALTKARASKWAEALFPEDEQLQRVFVEGAIEAAKTKKADSIEDFWEALRNEGGVSVRRISELFGALQSEGVKRPLICCEYRDIPRAPKAAKYELLGEELAKAIANDVTFAMFQPFMNKATHGAPDGPRQSLTALRYMEKVCEECERAYHDFARSAAAQLAQNKKKSETEARSEVQKRFRLYERSGPPYLGSGFQAKLFLVQYRFEGVNRSEILQWVSAPKDDLLVYRGDFNIEPEAVRDSFFPVPHVFESYGADEEPELPSLPKDYAKVEGRIRSQFGDLDTFPKKYHVWETYE